MLLGIRDDGFRIGFSTASQFQCLFLSIFYSEVLDHVNLCDVFSLVVYLVVFRVAWLVNGNWEPFVTVKWKYVDMKQSLT